MVLYPAHLISYHPIYCNKSEIEIVLPHHISKAPLSKDYTVKVMSLCITSEYKRYVKFSSNLQLRLRKHCHNTLPIITEIESVKGECKAGEAWRHGGEGIV